jgi:hypothetical protein
MSSMREEWLRHRHHEPGHSAVAWLGAGDAVLGNIGQEWVNGRLHGTAAVHWPTLERDADWMAAAAIAGAIAEAKASVLADDPRARIESKDEDLDRIAERLNEYSSALVGGWEPAEGGWNDLLVKVSPVLDPIPATISVDDVRRIPTDLLEKPRLKPVIERVIRLLNDADIWRAVEELARQIPEQAPHTLPAETIRHILKRVLPGRAGRQC